MNSLNDIWNIVLDSLRKDLNPTAMNTWFESCTPVDIDGNTFIIRTDNDFKKKIIMSRYADKITEVLSDLFSCSFELRILNEDEELEKNDPEGPIPEMEGYTFDRFIVGPSNKFAHAAAMGVASNPGSVKYNPLMIYGNSGLGKTHLLLAIGQSVHENNPGAKIAYMKGEEFANQLIKSIQEKTMENFREKYRNVDLLLIDDIQFIAGKMSTQEEFFHTFNNIYEAGHQIVITCDRPPMEMTLLDDRLRTRFEGGLMADIQPPDLETRMAIIRNKAATFGLLLSDESVNYIAEKLTTNVRQLEGVVKKLTAYKEILNDVITIDSVKRAIIDVSKSGDYIPTPEKIIAETGRYFGLTTDEITGQGRTKNTAQARQVSMYLIRSLTNLSLNDIGALFEGRNHSTVLTSIRKVEESIANDAAMKGTIRDITSNINSSDYSAQ